MRELLSYSNPNPNSAVPAATTEAGAAEASASAVKLDSEQRQALLEQRKRDLTSGNVSQYVPPQIQAHPAFIKAQQEAPTRVGGILGDLERIRSPIDGQKGPWGYPIDRNPPTATPVAPSEVPDYAKEMVAKYNALTEEHRSRRQFTGGEEASVPSISRWERQAVPDLTALSEEERRAWELQRQDVVAKTERMRQAPEAPPYNLSESGLQTVLDRIGQLRAKSRSMSPPPVSQPAPTTAESPPSTKEPKSEPTPAQVVEDAAEQVKVATEKLLDEAANN